MSARHADLLHVVEETYFFERYVADPAVSFLYCHDHHRYELFWTREEMAD